MSRSAIESDLRFSYDAFAKQSKAMIENRLETYFAHLDFYTNADVVKSGDSEQIWDWYKAHASVRPDVFDYVAWADRDGRFLADINSSSTISDRDYWQQIMIRGSDFAVDDPVTARSTGKTVTHICKAAKVNGQTVGFACGVVTVEHIERIIDGIDLKDIGVAVLFDSTGRVLATSSNKAAFIADFEKIKSSNFNNLPYVIANNKEVKTAKTTAQNASTAASNASQAASAASITASTSLGKLKQLVCENYATSANLFNEMLTKENQNTAKKAALDEWGKYVTSETQPTYRVTDAVSFDALFLFMYAMAKAGIINNIDQTTMNNFLNYLETAFGAYANTKDTKNRQELDAARVEWLNELG